jgi:SlyX protein
MPDPQDIDRRLTDLEIKASFTEDLVDRLNEVIVRQQAQIDLLLREVRALKEQGAPADAPPLPRDELPPHY